MQVKRSRIVIGAVSLAAVSLTALALVPRPPAPSSHSVAELVRVQSRNQNPDGLEFERRIVRGVPLSATQIVEITEGLTDGNTVVKTSTSKIFRDGHGRTRRDSLPEQASSGSETSTPTASIINDPVAGFSYSLDHRASLARRTVFIAPHSESGDSSSVVTRGGADRQKVLPVPAVSGGQSGLRSGLAENSATKSEALGVRDIEGVLAEGTRISMTVPKGAVGNEQPFEVVVERWYSPDLQAVVLVKRTGLKGGTTTYRLVDIKRAEPASALFIVPGDYKIRDETGREISAEQRGQ